MIRRPLEPLGKLFLALVLTVPFTAAAHPGHYHPGEEDEFDQLRADYFHLHGYLEVGLAALAVAAVAVLRFHANRTVKIGAAIALGGSLVLIVAL